MESTRDADGVAPSRGPAGGPTLEGAVPLQAAFRKACKRQSQSSSWFQLVKMRLTTFLRFHSEICDLRDPRRQPVALETRD